MLKLSGLQLPAKTMIKEIFIVLNAYIRKEEQKEENKSSCFLSQETRRPRTSLNQMIRGNDFSEQKSMILKKENKFLKISATTS